MSLSATLPLKTIKKKRNQKVVVSPFSHRNKFSAIEPVEEDDEDDVNGDDV